MKQHMNIFFYPNTNGPLEISFIEEEGCLARRLLSTSIIRFGDISTLQACHHTNFKGKNMEMTDSSNDMDLMASLMALLSNKEAM